MRDEAFRRFRSFPEAVLVQSLDLGTLAFDRRSGQTHVLADAAHAVWSTLGDEPVSASVVIARLADRFELDSQDDLPGVVAARLDELITIGLVEVLDETGPRR